MTERVHVELHLCLTVEEATAAFTALPHSPYCLIKGEPDARTATAEQATRQLAALVAEYGLTTIRREANDLPEWEHISPSDTRLVTTCRALVKRHLTTPHTEEGCQ